MLAWKKPELYAPPRHEEKAIFKENQPSLHLAVELRELRSSGAIRELHK